MNALDMLRHNALQVAPQQMISRLFQPMLQRGGGFPLQRFTSYEDMMNLMRNTDPLDSFFQSALGADSEGKLLSPILAADIIESKDAFKLSVDLPGVHADDITLEILDDGIHICGERKSSHEEQSKYSQHVERHWGKVSRVLPFPINADRSKASATFANGVLQLSIPKLALEPANIPLKIEINSAQPAGTENPKLNVSTTGKA